MTWEMPNSISPSRMSLFQQCPFRFRVETIQKLPQKTGPAAVAGTCIHSALEALMGEEPEARTPEALGGHVEEALKGIRLTADYLSLTEEDLKGFDAKVRRVAPRVFDVLDVVGTNVAGLELRLEVELDGWILRGIIDLLAEDEKGRSVIDHKSGRAPSERFQAKALLGLDFYSVMADIHFGERPREVSLLYLDSRLVISKEPSERSIRFMKSKILATRDAIDRACERDDFRPSPSKLCDWCGVRQYCPAHGGSPDDIPVPVNVRS